MVVHSLDCCLPETEGDVFFFFLVNILFISMYISGTISLLIVISQSCSTSRNKKTKQVQLAVMLVFNLLGDPFYITICFLQIW